MMQEKSTIETTQQRMKFEVQETAVTTTDSWQDVVSGKVHGHKDMSCTFKNAHASNVGEFRVLTSGKDPEGDPPASDSVYTKVAGGDIPVSSGGDPGVATWFNLTLANWIKVQVKSKSAGQAATVSSDFVAV